MFAEEATSPTPATTRMTTRVIVGRSIAIAALAAIGALFAWLNSSPWWAWLVAGVPVALTAIVLVVPLTRRRWLRATAWTLGAALTATAAISAGPTVQPLPAAAGGVPSASTVDTTEGPVSGVIDGSRAVEVFAGIPYAKPPVGDLRWKAPERPAPRKDVFEADHFSDIAMQDGADFITRALPKIIPFPLRPGLRNTSPMSEDALTLNIWRSTRPSAEPRPILVYIHGGGFRSGSSAVPLYDGTNLASHGDAIIVTINYRLGVFGYLSHPELAAESPDDASGNFGTLDQLAALGWIDENAAAFGGDNTRVTIAGESAGGEAVCILGATPLAAGLVDGIIAESGACMGTTGDAETRDQGDTRAVAEQAGERLADQLGMSIAEMRELPAEELQRAAADLADTGDPRSTATCSCVPRWRSTRGVSNWMSRICSAATPTRRHWGSRRHSGCRWRTSGARRTRRTAKTPRSSCVCIRQRRGMRRRCRRRPTPTAS